VRKDFRLPIYDSITGEGEGEGEGGFGFAYWLVKFPGTIHPSIQIKSILELWLGYFLKYFFI
jgi:hypothetical protein